MVVQAMVDADWAGVLFTADPVSGRRDRMVVEAVRGLGEALVSGEATGHHHLVDKRTGRVLTDDSPMPKGALDELVKLGTAVEDSFGQPQDIEWTYATGRCALVQARPLTALSDAPADPPDTTQTPPADRRRSRRTNRKRGRDHLTFAADHVPHPPYPMDRSLAIRPAVGAVLDTLRSVGFRVPDLDKVVVEIDDGVVQLVPPRIRPTPALLRTRPEDWRVRNATPP